MTGNAINRPLIRSVAFAAAIVGTIQATAWVCLSLVSILVYHSVITVDTNLSTYNYKTILYEIFLNHDNTNEDVIVTPQVFNGVMYGYVVSNFVWLITSLYMLWAMQRNKWINNSSVIGLWAGITILISILDVVTVGLVADDYVTIQDYFGQSISSTTTQLPTITTSVSTVVSEASTTDGTSTSTTDPSTSLTTDTIASSEPTTTITSAPEVTVAVGNIVAKSILNLLAGSGNIYDLGSNEMWKQIINTSYIIVISLAARGYILWIINIVFAFLLIKFARAISKSKTPSLLPMIDGYSTGRSPWSNLYEQTDIGNGYSNRGFSDENDKAVFPRSDSFITAEPETVNQNPLSNGNQNPLSNGSNPYAQQMEKLKPVPSNPNIVSPKLAKIGKQNGRRTPPRNVPPPNIPKSNSPYIPDPDYSPPASPLKPKSVLRPRSNYVL